MIICIFAPTILKREKYPMIKLSRNILLIFVALASAAVQAQESDETTFESARQAVENMRVGWNLGNTFDSNSGDTLNMWIEHWTSRTPADYEKAWGQVPTVPALFKMFKEAGFNAIRVPVTWYPHLEAKFHFSTSSNSIWSPSKDPLGTQINKVWMKRVRQVVDYIISQDMYCILNVHHDTGAANTAWLIADEDIYAQQRERFEAIWTQITEEFKDYDEHLLFEGYNEMLDIKRSWCFASFASEKRYDAAMAKSAYNAINSYAQSFVNAVRATGGNNAQRNLVVCTYGACDGNGNWNSHLQDPLKQMKLPEDPAEGHLIFEVHSYPDITNLSSAKSTVNTTISNLKSNLIRKGAPLIFGEWGISAGGDNRQNHVDFVKFFAQRCKANGIGLFYWMGLSDGEHRSVPEFNEPDLVQSMMEGYYGEGGYVGISDLKETDRTQPAHSRMSDFSEYYDPSGRRLARPHRGLIIQGGRKILIH